VLPERGLEQPRQVVAPLVIILPPPPASDKRAQGLASEKAAVIEVVTPFG